MNLTNSQIEGYVTEVYGDNFAASNPTLVTAFGTLLTTRIVFRAEAETSDEKYPRLSTLGLNNKTNPLIPAFSGGFDLNTFNPLRYQFDFFSDKTQIIRIDGTDLLMFVEPQ